MGPDIAGWLEDPAVVEVMLNPDGRLWVDRLSSGLADTGERLSPEDGERDRSPGRPTMSALRSTPARPGSPQSCPRRASGSRACCRQWRSRRPFAIRKPAVAVFTLADYAAAEIMTAVQAEALRRAVADRKNILVAGGTSTGKTTLVNALLAEVAKTADRVVLIEDTRELQCSAPNLVALRTKDGVVSLSDLVRAACACAPTASPSARFAAQRRWTCSRPGAPVILAASAPCTPAPR